MQERVPDIERKEAKDTCAISQQGQTRLAFLYHRKTSPEVTIYFRADPDLKPRRFPRALRLQARPKINSPWEKTFPYFFTVSTIDNLEEVASFLMEEAYPLSLKMSVRATTHRPEYFSPEEVDSNADFIEGTVRSVRVNAYERNREAREGCLRHYGTICFACGFSFPAAYGEHFSGFIHVPHHNSDCNCRSRISLGPYHRPETDMSKLPRGDSQA
jgi:hypothetical protein